MKAVRQRGVALLTVLLMVAVMSVLVIGVLDDIRFGIRRAGNADAVAQAQRYALGAETLAAGQIQRLSRRDPARTTLEGNWNDRPFLFPLGDSSDAGAMSVRVVDATSCFNLNSVVEGAGEQWQRRELGVAQFVALLRALEFRPDQANALSDGLVDWIDADQQASPRGAEDSHYLARRSHRTGSTLLAEASELRAVAGFDAETYARLRPWVCALPVADLSPLNINTLEPGDGALLSMLTAGAIDPAQGHRIIQSRPPGGWRDFATFWAQPGLSSVQLPNPVLGQVSLRTRYFGLHAEVEHGGAQVVLSALLEQDDAGQTRLLARRWSGDD